MALEEAFAIKFISSNPKIDLYPVIHTKRDMDDVRRLVQAVNRNKEVTLKDITIMDVYSEVPGVMTLCLNGLPIASIAETMHEFGDRPDPLQLNNLCEEISLPSLRSTAYQLNIKQWIDDVLKAMKDHPELVSYIDSMPEELKKIGDTHIVIPSPEDMTEDMVEATRSLLLYTDVYSTSDSERVCKRISMRPWVADNLPDWFKNDRGHLTKDGRAALAYHLTAMAAIRPPKPEEKYFPETKPQPREKASKLGFELTLFYGDKELVVSRLFETIRSMVTHDDMLDILINRHQLPADWRKLFKKNAIEISGRITKTPEDSEISLDNVSIRLGLKAEHVHMVSQRFIGSKRIPVK